MRIWQTRFQVVRALESLPIPLEIVYEKQTGPEYHIDECWRGASDVAQIVCTRSGEGAFRCRDKVRPLTADTVFVNRVGDPDISYYYPGHASGPWFFLWISFSGKQAVRIVRELTERYGQVFRFPPRSALVSFLESFHSRRDTFQILSPTVGAKIVQDALAAFGETVEGGMSTSTQAELTRNAQLLISAHIDRSLDMAQIAEKLHVTREHLTRVFRSQTGISPGQFAASERMRIAVRLLMTRSVSVKEISGRLGYDSASSFARAFRNHFGVSPGAFTIRPEPLPDAAPENWETANTGSLKRGENTSLQYRSHAPSRPRNTIQTPAETHDPCAGLRDM